MAATTPTKSSPYFFTLPLEIRQHIYSHLLTPWTATNSNASLTSESYPCYEDDRLYFSRFDASVLQLPALRHEALQTAFLNCRMYWTAASIEHILGDHAECTCLSHVREATLDLPTKPEQMTASNSAFLTRANGIRKLRLLVHDTEADLALMPVLGVDMFLKREAREKVLDLLPLLERVELLVCRRRPVCGPEVVRDEIVVGNVTWAIVVVE